jgi:hypothetical protein
VPLVKMIPIAQKVTFVIQKMTSIVLFRSEYEVCSPVDRALSSIGDAIAQRIKLLGQRRRE